MILNIIRLYLSPISVLIIFSTNEIKSLEFSVNAIDYFNVIYT